MPLMVNTQDPLLLHPVPIWVYALKFCLSLHCLPTEPSFLSLTVSEKNRGWEVTWQLRRSTSWLCGLVLSLSVFLFQFYNKDHDTSSHWLVYFGFGWG